MAAKYPYYLLADSPEGVKKEMELGSNDFSRSFGETTKVVATLTMGDIRKGFVYKRVPHVTLKAIANNEEIDAIHARWQAPRELPAAKTFEVSETSKVWAEPLRLHANTALGQAWEEWQAPRELPAAKTFEVSETSKVWAEAMRADLNTALGQAWEEWQAPRELPAAKTFEVSETSKVWAEPLRLHAAFWQARRDRQAEIDASIARRAETETLYDQPYEDRKRVRVAGPFTVESLSPHRVLSTEEGEDHPGAAAVSAIDFTTMILDNLKKAGVQNTRKAERLTFDRLDPFAGTWLHAAGEYTDAAGKTRRVAVSVGPQHVKEAAKEAVQGIGFDLLVVCGFAFDPHVSEEAKRYGQLTVLPTKMNPDLAYFTGADEPYDKLKRALRAEVDEAAWAALYRTVSRPFARPASGKLAVKVINHYGDEVLKVYDVANH